MRPPLLTTLLLLLVLPLAGMAESRGSSGGLSPDGPPGCQKTFTAKEHNSWAKRYLRREKIPAKARKRHQKFVRCAQNERSAKHMKNFWLRVKKSILPANHDLWIRIGLCEQPGKGYRGIYWSHPGPTYQGGLGFWYGTWDSFKSPGMPANAGDATWRQQMKVANKLLRLYGTSPWGCA